MIDRTFLCPVCGFQLDRPAWVDRSPSDEICPSCGIQFGYSDFGGGDIRRRKEIYKIWRQKWIDGGMEWHDSGITDPPTNWDPKKQLERLLEQGK